VLKYGKFKGKSLSDPEVESGYLEHLVTMAKRTITECTAELERRKQLSMFTPPPDSGDRLGRLEKMVEQLAQSMNGNAKRPPF
jgi:hypothetical protein